LYTDFTDLHGFFFNVIARSILSGAALCAAQSKDATKQSHCDTPEIASSFAFPPPQAEVR
jgi:hypothetical protein